MEMMREHRLICTLNLSDLKENVIMISNSFLLTRYLFAVYSNIRIQYDIINFLYQVGLVINPSNKQHNSREEPDWADLF